MKSLFIAWQDPETRLWYTVGRLTREEGVYCFVYTQGAEATPRFSCLGRMTDLNGEYFSEDLFPLFRNRLLYASRPEYPDYVRWLDMENENNDPLLLLGRSGGKRATDSLCVFPEPEPDAEGKYSVYFFSHGLRYLDRINLEGIARLQAGDILRLKREDHNEHDRFALVLETDEKLKVGYCPRYLNKELRRVQDVTSLRLIVEKVNPEAPLHFRLLCRTSFTLPQGIDLFTSEEYQPLSKVLLAA